MPWLTFEMEDASESETPAVWHLGECRVTLKQELQVCSKVWLWLLMYFLVMEYTSSILFRNLAFTRYQGLEVYAEKVAPRWAGAPTESAGVLLSDGSSIVPLSKALEGSPYSHGWNISVEIEAPRANLSALGGEPFNLRDISQEYLPDFSHDEGIAFLSEFVAGSSIVMWVLIVLLPLFVSFRGKKRPYVAAMALRTLRAAFVVHILRIPTYLTTTLPGAAPHCQSVRWPSNFPRPKGGWEENQKHLRTVWDLFSSTYNLTHNSNCGDLVFSGHTVTTATLLVAVCYYADQMLPKWMRNIIVVTSTLLLLLQVFLIVTVHNHYTVDVVIAAYLAPLNFWAWLHLAPTESGADCSRETSTPRSALTPVPAGEAV